MYRAPVPIVPITWRGSFGQLLDHSERDSRHAGLINTNNNYTKGRHEYIGRVSQHFLYFIYHIGNDKPMKICDLFFVPKDIIHLGSFEQASGLSYQSGYTIV